MIKFVTDFRVPLVVNFVGRKKSHPRAKFALVQRVLSIFDLDIFLTRFKFRTAGVGSSQTLVQVEMARVILQLSRNFKGRLLGIGRKIDPEKFSESQVGIF
jgi:hypothetical protein